MPTTRCYHWPMTDEPRFAGLYPTIWSLDPISPVRPLSPENREYRHAPQPECRCHDCREWRVKFGYPEPKDTGTEAP
jgi:hypothetical protein